VLFALLLLCELQLIYTNISVFCEATFFLNFHFHLIINHSNKSIFESKLGSSFTERDFNLLGGSRKMLLIIQLDNNKIIIYYQLIINLCIYFGD